MRKFLVSLLLVVIAAGVAFYFGWIQLQLPADTYGVIFTKTNGFEQNVVKPGTFVWRWQRLLPTNLTLFTYQLKPQESEVAKTAKLLMGIASLTIILGLAAVLLGFFLGGGRAMYRVMRGKPASSAMEEEFIALDLNKPAEPRVSEPADK